MILFETFGEAFQPEKAFKSNIDNTTDSPKVDCIFHSMQELPQVAQDLKGNDEKFSKTVMLYDEADIVFCQLGYYDFEFKEWNHFGEESMRFICWCYPPNPKEFIKNNELKSIKHKGYRD